MNTRGAGIAMTVAMSLLDAGVAAQAAEPAAEGTAAPLTVSGRLASVDSERGSLVIESGGERMELWLGGQTTIEQDGLRLEAGDLPARPDERVKAAYAEEAGRLVAQAITFEKPAGLSRTTGTIERLDLLRGELVVKPGGLFGGSNQAFAFSERTLVAHEGQRSYPSFLRIGDQVAVEWSKDGGQKTARLVTIKRPRKPLFEMDRGSPQTPQQGPGGPAPAGAKPQ
jgi:hypothetical protein